MERFAAASPRPKARTTGVVYLLFFLTAILGATITPGTANDIVAHETTFRLGFAISLLSLAFYVALTALFYNLFRHVNRNVALLAVLFSLVGCTVQAFGSLFQLAPFVVLGDSQDPSAFSAQQLHALAQMLLNLSVPAGYIGIVFFGVFDILLGYLIFRSTFLPRVLGVLMVVAGLGWLIFLAPPLANHVLIFIEVPGFIAELALMLWLFIRGVNTQRWNELAGAVSV
jgi:uncharacterized protein DUF4386